MLVFMRVGPKCFGPDLREFHKNRGGIIIIITTTIVVIIIIIIIMKFINSEGWYISGWASRHLVASLADGDGG